MMRALAVVAAIAVAGAVVAIVAACRGSGREQAMPPRGAPPLKRYAGFDLEIAGTGAGTGSGGGSGGMAVRVAVRRTVRAGEPVTSEPEVERRIEGALVGGRLVFSPVTLSVADEPQGHPCNEQLVIRVEVAGGTAPLPEAELLLRDTQSGVAAQVPEGWTATPQRGATELAGPLGLTLTYKPSYVTVD